MNNNYIGIFDSGIGGLTVVKALKEMMPNENIIYFGDSKNAPYGDKSNKEIIELVKNNISFLKEHNIKLIGVACNTADGIAIDNIDINLPVVRIIKPTCIQALHVTTNKKIGIIATAAAINSGAYQNTITSLNKDIQVYPMACPKLVPYIESGNIENDEITQVLQEYLLPLKEKQIDTLILGCTHYPILTKQIMQILPNVNIVSSSYCAANLIKETLINNDMQSEKHKQDYIYTSGNPNEFDKIASILLGSIKAIKKE